ncbi:hypothetical protein Tco_1102783 [Tanacetum coccineum]
MRTKEVIVELPDEGAKLYICKPENKGVLLQSDLLFVYDQHAIAELTVLIRHPILKSCCLLVIAKSVKMGWSRGWVTVVRAEGTCTWDDVDVATVSSTDSFKA